jgi:hypothetical protein
MVRGPSIASIVAAHQAGDPMAHRSSKLFQPGLTVLALAVLAMSAFCPGLLAQGPSPDAPTASSESASMAFVTPTSAPRAHRFWDKENGLLFGASATLSAADFAITRANLQSGGRDLNPVVRFFGPSTAGLAVNFAGETAGVIGVSYLLHKTGHHKLERLFTMVNIGSSAGAVSYDLVIR